MSTKDLHTSTGLEKMAEIEGFFTGSAQPFVSVNEEGHEGSAKPEQEASTEEQRGVDTERAPKKRIEVVVDEDLYYRVRAYLVSSDGRARWSSLSAMVRGLLEEEIAQRS